MQVCVIHGSPRKGNTHRATEIFKNELRQHGPVESAEFCLPRDNPSKYEGNSALCEGPWGGSSLSKGKPHGKHDRKTEGKRSCLQNMYIGGP